ncbi:MAG: hypothetical protein WC352_06505 [Candidatus Omnitrophota bacterium]|jgi:hypothetical protein
MCIQKHLSKFLIPVIAAGLLAAGAGVLYAGDSAAEFKKQKGGFYTDLFDQNIYYEGTNYLHLERLWRGISGKKLPASDVNRYDEVPDSLFFTNRHARTRLSEKALAEGYRETAGPDWSKLVTIISADVEEGHLLFYVRDAKGDDYQLRFDVSENFELATSAEVIASRFYYAIGYNVPQYTVEIFEASKLVLDPNAFIYDESGFRGKFTPERLEEALMAMPLDPQGRHRVSACKIPAGSDKGKFSFHGRRADDAQDGILHKDRREIRALLVFASWLNNTDVREGNTKDLFLDEKGNKVLKHYLVNFRSSLGSGGDGTKPPEFGHENLIDYGQVAKSFVTLGLFDDPWQKRWESQGEKPHPSPAVGYFDNLYFEPGAFKTVFPNFAFKDMTRADAFWAAKIVKSFTNEDLRTMVGAGKLTDPKDAEYVTTTLLNRRDLLAKYWFSQASPLDDFQLKGEKLTFTDLGVETGLWNPEGNQYSAEIFEMGGKKPKKVSSLESTETSFDLQNLLAGDKTTAVSIRTLRTKTPSSGPSVMVEISGGRITAVAHED